MKKIVKTEKEKGFALLFAILLTVLIVSISASIISVSLRQTILSGTVRDSEYAFYAANTALECALYWDFNNAPNAVQGEVVFPFSGAVAEENTVSNTDGLECLGGNIVTGENFETDFTYGGWTQSDDSTNFRIEISNDVQDLNVSYCAEVTVEKIAGQDSESVTTNISVKGYNTCDLTNPRAVERGIVFSYSS